MSDPWYKGMLFHRERWSSFVYGHMLNFSKNPEQLVRRYYPFFFGFFCPRNLASARTVCLNAIRAERIEKEFEKSRGYYRDKAIGPSWRRLVMKVVNSDRTKDDSDEDVFAHSRKQSGAERRPGNRISFHELFSISQFFMNS